MTTSQCMRVLDYMADFGGITQLEAIKDIGVMRLASRISDLRQRGIDITDDWLTITNRYGEKCRVKRYMLTEEDKA